MPTPFAPLAADERDAWGALTALPGIRGHAARTVSSHVHALHTVLAEIASAAPTYTDESADWAPVERCALCHVDVTRYGPARGFHLRGCLYVRAVALAGLDDPPPTLE